jgi:transposase-like protein
MDKVSSALSLVKPGVTPAPWSTVETLDSHLALIQALIPLGLAAVAEALQSEVAQLAGARYGRKGSQTPYRRWGQQPGSVMLQDQKLAVQVPRVRNVVTGQEQPLTTYQQLQVPRQMDRILLQRLLHGLACRQYEACAEVVPQTFGLSASAVSRRFIRATAHQLRRFQERDLSDYDLVALVLDGKSFAQEEMIIALGITLEGDKVLLGFVQAASENERVCRQFIQGLLDRGLRYQQGLLVLLDGAKGLYNGVSKPLQGHVVVQRCQWHKRENVCSYLSKAQQPSLRRALQKAYNQPTYEQAQAALNALKPQLALCNQSALASLEEGLEETLTLHRLGLMPYLKMSFRTTNMLESINSQVEQRTGRVKRWTTSAQRARWLAAALLDIEPRLRKVRGVAYLPLLRHALLKELNLLPSIKLAPHA